VTRDKFRNLHYTNVSIAVPLLACRINTEALFLRAKQPLSHCSKCIIIIIYSGEGAMAGPWGWGACGPLIFSPGAMGAMGGLGPIGPPMKSACADATNRQRIANGIFMLCVRARCICVTNKNGNQGGHGPHREQDKTQMCENDLLVLRHDCKQGLT
jgi:hypothetical protein